MSSRNIMRRTFSFLSIEMAISINFVNTVGAKPNPKHRKNDFCRLSIHLNFRNYWGSDLEGVYIMHFWGRFCKCSPISVKAFSEGTIPLFWNTHMECSDLTILTLLLDGDLHLSWELEKLNSNISFVMECSVLLYPSLTTPICLDLLTLSPPETMKVMEEVILKEVPTP